MPFAAYHGQYTEDLWCSQVVAFTDVMTYRLQPHTSCVAKLLAAVELEYESHVL